MSETYTPTSQTGSSSTWRQLRRHVEKMLPSRAGFDRTPDFCEPAFQFIEQMVAALPEPIRSETEHLMADLALANRERLVSGVNLPRSTSADRMAVTADIRSGLADRNSRHLEMGVNVGFPDERVASLKSDLRLGEFLRLDLDTTVPADVVADCSILPFADGVLDSVGSDSLFEHMRFPHQTIRESYRVLGPGGIMQINMPFFFTIHNYPGDYIRLTPQFLEETCREVGFEEVYCHVHDFGGLYYTLHNSSKQVLINDFLEPATVRAAARMHANVMTLLLLAAAFDRFFHGESRNFFIGVYCVAFKAGGLPHRPAVPAITMPDRILPYLVCPVSRQPLKRTSAERLSSADERHHYEIRNGIPVLLGPPRTAARPS